MMAKGIIRRVAMCAGLTALLSGSVAGGDSLSAERKFTEILSTTYPTSEPIHLAPPGPRVTVPDSHNRSYEYEIIGDNEATERILNSIDAEIIDGRPSKHCWEWIDRVYNGAGIPLEDREIVYNRHRSLGRRHMSRRQLRTLETGDWIYVHNGNNRDKYGNHSVVFIDWINERRRVALIAESPGTGHPGRYSTMNFRRKPVVLVSKPPQLCKDYE